MLCVWLAYFGGRVGSSPDGLAWLFSVGVFCSVVVRFAYFWGRVVSSPGGLAWLFSVTCHTLDVPSVVDVRVPACVIYVQ